MNNDTSTRILPFNAWIFGFVWVLLHVACYFVLDYLLFRMLAAFGIGGGYIETWSFRYFANLFLFAILNGLVFGAVEWYLLQRYFEWPISWIGVTVIGWLLFEVWYRFVFEFATYRDSATVLIGAPIVANLLLAGTQWFVLRKEVDYAWLWIVVSIVSGFIASFIITPLTYLGVIAWYGETSQFADRIISEMIKVSCLIWLLYVTLKQEKIAVQPALE